MVLGNSSSINTAIDTETITGSSSRVGPNTINSTTDTWLGFTCITIHYPSILDCGCVVCSCETMSAIHQVGNNAKH